MRAGERFFALGRRIGRHPLASYAFCATERFLPVRRVGRYRHTVAFAHPRPSYNPHLLVVPTRPFAALASPGLAVERKARMVWDCMTLARRVTTERDDGSIWTIVFNGGIRQEIGQVHGHVITRAPVAGEFSWELEDPTVNLDPWRRLFAAIAALDLLEGNGYSLVATFTDGTRVNAHLNSDLAVPEPARRGAILEKTAMA